MPGHWKAAETDFRNTELQTGNSKRTTMDQGLAD